MNDTQKPIEERLKNANFSVNQAFRERLHEKFISQVRQHQSAPLPTSVERLTKLFALFAVPVAVAVLAVTVFQWKNNDTNTTIIQALKPRELLAVSMERTFGETDPSVFRFQRFISAEENTIAMHERWSYQQNVRNDYYTLVLSRALNYSSALTYTEAEKKLFCGHQTFRNNPDMEFIGGDPNCSESTVTYEDPSAQDLFINNLRDSVAALHEPTKTVEETYQGYNAIRSTYALTVEKHMSFLPRDASKNITIEFLLLVDQQQVVEVTHKEQSTGHVISRFTVAEDYVINDQTPNTFFSEEYWKGAMSTIESSLHAFNEDAQNYALPSNPTGEILQSEDGEKFVSSLYPILFTLPPAKSGWEVEVSENKEGSSELITLHRADPQTTLEYGHFVNPNQARFRAHVIQKNIETDYYAELLADLQNTAPTTVDDTVGMFGMSHTLEREEFISVSGHSAKLRITHNPVAEDPILGDDTLVLLVQIDDTTILKINAAYGLGEDHDLLKQDILNMIDSLEITDRE